MEISIILWKVPKHVTHEKLFGCMFSCYIGVCIQIFISQVGYVPMMYYAIIIFEKDEILPRSEQFFFLKSKEDNQFSDK